MLEEHEYADRAHLLTEVNFQRFPLRPLSFLMSPLTAGPTWC